MGERGKKIKGKKQRRKQSSVENDANLARMEKMTTSVLYK